MASDTIRIKAKKISEIETINSSFSLNEHGNNSYLLLSYKDNNNPQNFRISLQQLAQQILSQPGTINTDDFYTQLVNMLQNPNIHNSLKGDNGESAYQIAKRLGLTSAPNEEEFIRTIINNAEYNYQPDADITTNDKYIFTYAPESSVYLTLNNGAPSGITDGLVNAIWTQKTTGRWPSRNLNNDGIYLKDYNYKQTNDYNNQDNNYSFIWNPIVRTGKIWIIVPEHFFDTTTCSFLDNNSHKWKICDALHKEPIEPVAIKKITNCYLGETYIFFCFSTNGAVGKVYFKKIS